MKNFLEVKEFDSIICNEDYKDDLRYKFLNKSIFDELINFIRTYSSEDNTDLLDFMKISYKRNVGEIINILCRCNSDGQRLSNTDTSQNIVWKRGL